ncbi:CDP-6-deoxy-delta-3,4-glucoseen reductase [Sulfuricystis multivorans]|uniref:CDP-6-deoxy-delta-3,4-glucoseen reductase n=1 Tax=Sulfuricystis multivorans TaxID=2211108 RepID=UPI000F832AFA|nr:CDP-6-deoxy-delta-3,4-glucoseen reductase [Sulfuricystis multivorans]
MAHQVTLQPSGHSFSVADGATILEAALDAGIHLPYGCKNGACGACKAKVLRGKVDLGAAQESALPADERVAGMALMCCARPLSDVIVEVHEVNAARDIPVKTLPCRVEQLERVADDVMVIHLKLPSNERLQFLAGQYIEFLLAGGKRRAFSLANAPHADDLLELHVRHIPGGNFTEHVFSKMKVKEILRIEGPFGSFHLREESDKPILLVAGGTGFAPIKGLIEHALHIGIKRPMALYWGAKNRAGLYLNALCERWAQENGIRYTPVLSEPDADWQGRTGLVHEVVLADHPDLSAYQAYVCGAPAMCEAAQRDFVAHGLPPQEFFADVFSYAAK